MNQKPNLWLQKLFNSHYFNTSMIVLYLYKYPEIGLQHYLCDKLRGKLDVQSYIPELVQIMFHRCEGSISQPVYRFLIEKAKMSRKFALTVYFVLQCYDGLDVERKKWRDLMMWEIICNDEFVYYRVKNKQSLKIKREKWKKMKTNKAKKDIIEGEYIIKNKVENRNDISMHKNNLLRNKIGISFSYTLHRTKRICLCLSQPDLYGILFYFLKSTVFFNPQLFNALNLYESVFMHRINPSRKREGNRFDGTIFKTTPLLGNILFLDELVQISKRLKQLPRNLRQKALNIELAILNHNLPANLIIPFDKWKNELIVKIHVKESRILDSAENSPFLLVFEVADKIADFPNEINEEIINVGILLNQLSLVETKDTVNIKERVLESLKFINSGEMSNDKDDNIPPISESDNLELMLKPQSKKKFKIPRPSLFGFMKKDRMSVPLQLEDWKNKKKAISSNFKSLKGWNLRSVIIKSGNDLTKEMIATKLIKEIKNIFVEDKKKIYITDYQIYLIERNSGLIETIVDAYSVHQIKSVFDANSVNSSTNSTFLKNYFLAQFGSESGLEYKIAVENFLASLVGYSLVTYLLQVKDRHNGNILIDKEGHIIHIDFGFILGDHPGFTCFETAPFKFSGEYLDLLGDLIGEFKMRFIDGFMSLRKFSDRLSKIIEIMMGPQPANGLIDRFKMELDEKEIEAYIISLIDWSMRSMTTGLYDSYQYFSNGYLK
ncbi:Phosphatidylinositol 4-kinase beta [Astathelohania contejeani]|uniref:Phosphatidylinositol 4-kinase beta n=1 Tax=Astathelohania contejeani TaxID=164912 RepID=A0ABQ7HXF7_9MICR|nr:Phosphatidylinositol 4-kinase beta [Thelohania contejeani]